MMSEDRLQHFDELQATADDAYSQVSNLLPTSGMTEANGSVAVQYATNETAFPFRRDNRPLYDETFVFDEPNGSKSFRYSPGGKDNAPGFSTILGSDAIWLFDQLFDYFEKVAILGANLDRSAEETTVAPDKADQPSNRIIPSIEEPVIEGESEDGLGFTAPSSPPVLCPSAHHCFLLGVCRMVARTAAVRPMGTVSRVWFLANSTEAFHCMIIRQAMCHFLQRCHLGMDRPHHLAKQKKNREARRLAVQPRLPLEETKR